MRYNFTDPELRIIKSSDTFVQGPYHEAQSVPGTLAYPMGAGKGIFSTPYWHAAERLDDGRGALAPLGTLMVVRRLVLLHSLAHGEGQIPTQSSPNRGRNWIRLQVRRCFVRSYVRFPYPNGGALPSSRTGPNVWEFR